MTSGTQPSFSLSVTVSSANETTAIARALAPFLRAGDVVLLDGPIGAGKTHFARQVILRLLSDHGVSEDVPSPTYTLVQTYQAGDTEIWHADLYRVFDATELLELGIEDAMDDAIVLIEWPDKPGAEYPANALRITFDVLDTGRRLTFTGQSAAWQSRIAACIGDTE